MVAFILRGTEDNGWPCCGGTRPRFPCPNCAVGGHTAAAKVIPYSLHTRARIDCYLHRISEPHSRAAGVIQEARMTSTDLFLRRANECRRLAAAARDAADK